MTADEERAAICKWLRANYDPYAEFDLAEHHADQIERLAHRERNGHEGE